MERMERTLVHAIVLIAMCAGAAGAAAQNIYKCGDGYSQQPCPGGKSLAVDDSRSDAQKKQASAAARRDARLADGMEKERLKQEAQPVPSYVPPPNFPPTPDRKPEPSSKPRKPEAFTAVVPGSKPAKDDKKKDGKAKPAEKKPADKPAAR